MCKTKTPINVVKICESGFVNFGFLQRSTLLIDPCVSCGALPVFVWSQLWSLESCDLLWHESFNASSYLTIGCDELTTHPSSKTGQKGNRCGRGISQSLAFNYKVVTCSQSRSEYQVCPSQTCTSFTLPDVKKL